jgi:hypothetical protein
LSSYSSARPETFDEKKKWAQDHFEAQLGQRIEETTPPAITPAIVKFAASLGGSPEFVPVKQDEYGLFGWCSDGVLEKVKSDGGGIRFGWTIWEWPRIFFNAEFHAVWISPIGELIDITPKPQREAQIVFVPDDSYPNDFNFDNRPTNRRFRIPQEPNYGALAEAEISKMKATQLEYEQRRAAKKGLALQEWVAAKLPRPSFPGLVEELIHICEACERKSDELAGANNLFSPDKEYWALEKRKAELLHAARLAAAKES